MQHLLFVLKNTFDYNFKYSFEDDTEQYNQILENDWFSYWQSRGDEIVNSFWLDKYTEYLVTNEQESFENTETHSVHESDKQASNEKGKTLDSSENNSQAENSLKIDSYSDHWQELWNEHYSEVYQKIFNLFSQVHYSHYSFYSQNPEDVFEEVPESESEFLDERNQLQALGLPTSFGRSNNKYYNSRHRESSIESLESDQEENMPPTQKQLSNQHIKKKKKNRKLKRMPKFILEDKSLRSYWHKRFALFSRFDEGIQLDRESWFSVTPEKVAIHMAERLKCDTIIDAFCGSGGNAIQFAQTCSKVIAIDIDPEKIKNARHNASIYGVANKIEFIIGDFLHLSEGLKGDVVFLSPPWGGPQYISQKVYDIEESLVPIGATDLAEKSRRISENFAFFLPKNSNPNQIAKLAGIGNRVEVEHNYLDTWLVGLTAIYGDWLIDKNNLSDK